MSFPVQNLQEIARDLSERLAALAAADPQAAGLSDALAPLMARIRAGEVTEALDWRDIPGDLLFNEGGLARHEGLEHAYACFKIAATGGHEDMLALLRQIQDDMARGA